MKPVITKYDPQRAGVYQNGNLRAFDLVPEGQRSTLVFHWVEVSPKAETVPEKNDVAKTFLFFEGRAEVNVDGEKGIIEKGNVLFLPAGSSHAIQNGADTLRFIVVKSKN
jgi:quercetin dioxygenase-like cupin family protein